MHINDGEVFLVKFNPDECNIELTRRTSSGDPILVERVLEVETSRLCYIVGTVYMDMPMKPNIIEDIARDVG